MYRWGTLKNGVISTDEFFTLEVLAMPNIFQKMFKPTTLPIIFNFYFQCDHGHYYEFDKSSVRHAISLYEIAGSRARTSVENSTRILKVINSANAFAGMKYKFRTILPTRLKYSYKFTKTRSPKYEIFLACSNEYVKRCIERQSFSIQHDYYRNLGKWKAMKSFST